MRSQPGIVPADAGVGQDEEGRIGGEVRSEDIDQVADDALMLGAHHEHVLLLRVHPLVQGQRDQLQVFLAVGVNHGHVAPTVAERILIGRQAEGGQAEAACGLDLGLVLRHLVLLP